MKMKLYILIAGTLLISTFANSQVYTPNGSLVPDTKVVSEQLTSYDIAYIMQDMAYSYPNAVIIGNPTTTYNCHAYAWHISEGGTPNVWMGLSTNPTPVYWYDGSYVETAKRGNGLKVSYANPPYSGYNDDNHSAITTAETDILISKWGAYPLVKHAKDYTPYNSSNLHYYCPTLVNFTNQIVTTNTTVTSCGDINIENVTVKNGAKLTLNAPGEVNIGNNFEVENDGEFEIIEN
jgi:hypothetical protein